MRTVGSKSSCKGMGMSALEGSVFDLVRCVLYSGSGGRPSDASESWRDVPLLLCMPDKRQRNCHACYDAVTEHAALNRMRQGPFTKSEHTDKSRSHPGRQCHTKRLSAKRKNANTILSNSVDRSVLTYNTH